MGSGNTTLKVTIVGDSKSGQKAFKDTGSAADGLAGKMGKLGKGIGLALGVGAVGGIVAVGAAMVTGVKDAAAYQTLGLKTAAVLKSTGNVAHQSVSGIQARAGALESLSGVDETLIINGQNVLATFTKIRDEQGKGNDIFNQATKASLNLSTALGTDLQGATTMVGKALNDPVKGLTAMGKAGIQFTDAQKKSIKAMVKSGDTMGAQKIILKELETQFGGAAKAAGGGFAGSMARAEDSVMDTLRSLGTMLLPVLTKVADFFATKIGPAVQNFVTEFQKGTGAGGKLRTMITNVVGAVQNFVTEFQNGTGAGGTFKAVLITIKDALVTMWNTGVSVTGWLNEHRTAVVAAGVAVGVLMAVTKAHAVVMNVQAAGGLMKMISSTKIVTAMTKTWAAVQWIMNAALSANPIGLVVLAVGLLVGAIVIIATKTTWFQSLWKIMVSSLAATWRWLWNSIIAPIIRWIVGGFASIAGGIASFLRGLSDIPGFGWAKTAADKMQSAADKANKLANNIRDIPDTTVVVTTKFTYPGYSAVKARSVNGQNAIADIRGNAGGGRNLAAGLSWVGEEGPELMFVPGGSDIYTARDSARMAASGGAVRPSKGMGAGGGNSGGVNVYVTVQGNVTAERDLARAIAGPVRDELVKIGRRNGGSIFPK